MGPGSPRDLFCDTFSFIGCFSLFWQLFNMNKKFHSVNLESLMNQIMNQTSLSYMAFYFVFENSWLWEFRHLQSLQSTDINTRVCRSRLFYFFRLRSCRSAQSIFLAKYHVLICASSNRYWGFNCSINKNHAPNSFYPTLINKLWNDSYWILSP